MKNSLSFEESITRLEEIVSALEEGNLPLEDSLKLFEEGTKLAKLCNTTLEKAEQKIITLTNEESSRKEEYNE